MNIELIFLCSLLQFNLHQASPGHSETVSTGSLILCIDQKDGQWPFSQKFLQFLVRFSVKNFVREILRAFNKRIRSLFNLKISLTRNSSIATISKGLIFL